MLFKQKLSIKRILIIFLISLLIILIALFRDIPYESPQTYDDRVIAPGVGELRQVLELYSADHGEYPVSLQMLTPEYTDEIGGKRESGGYYFTYERVDKENYEICVDYIERDDECIYSP